MKTESQLIELLLVYTGSRTQLTELPGSDEAWKQLFLLAERHTVFGVANAAVDKLPVEQQPSVELRFWALSVAEKHKQRSRKMNAACVKLCDRLLEDGIRTSLLKGQGIALLYPDPLDRTPGDIDLWFEGSRSRTVAYVRRHFSRLPVVYHHMDLPVFNKIAVEAHFTPSWMYSPLANSRLQRFFRQLAPGEFTNLAALPEGAGRVAVSTPRLNRVFILVHIYRHLLDEGIGLRQLLDYYYVLQATQTDAERAEALRVLRSLGMKRFTAATMHALQRLFGLPEDKMLTEPDAREGEFLLSEVMRAGNFGKYDTRFGLTEKRVSRAAYFLRKQRRNLHFLFHYPREVAWHPLFRIWQFLWRWQKGYL